MSASTSAWDALAKKLQLSYSKVCITGTGTGVGKTIVTGKLAKAMSNYGSVVTQKWVQAGDLNHSDITIHDSIVGGSPVFQKEFDQYEQYRQVYQFSMPASPHLAATHQTPSESVDIQALKEASLKLSQAFDMLLVETSGGIMVPLTQSYVTSDLVKSLNLPVIVVVPNELGCINHALLSFEHLKQQNIPIIGFIMNNYFDCPTLIQDDNPQIIESISGIDCLLKLGTVIKQ